MVKYILCIVKFFVWKLLTQEGLVLEEEINQHRSAGLFEDAIAREPFNQFFAVQIERP